MSEETVFSDRRKPLSRKTLSPGRALCLGFLALILAGGLLLTLPAASADGTSLGLLKGMFTATSAVCVTGLSLIEAGRDLSLFGQIVLLCLIQVGGLGFMAFATLGMVLIGRRISLHSRILLSESMNQNGLSGMVRLSLWFFAMALAIELTGAALLASRLIPRYGTARGLWLSLFTAVSAFCNAGFDLFGNGDSLLAFRQDPVVLWTLIGLIQLGGMGFAVMLELLRHRKSLGRMSLHTKLVLAVNGALLVGGSLAVFLLEGRNPATLGREGMTLWDKVTGSVFQAVTCRTAGFAAVRQDALNDSTKLIELPDDAGRRVPRVHRRRYQDHHAGGAAAAGAQRGAGPGSDHRLPKGNFAGHRPPGRGADLHCHLLRAGRYLRPVDSGAPTRCQPDESGF